MKCFFVMWHDGPLGKKGTLRCGLVVHVGDTLGAGDGTSAIVRIELRKQLRFGTWENVQEVEGVFFCGRWAEQRVDFVLVPSACGGFRAWQTPVAGLADSGGELRWRAWRTPV